MCTKSDSTVLHVGFASGCNRCVSNATQLIHVGTFTSFFVVGLMTIFLTYCLAGMDKSHMYMKFSGGHFVLQFSGWIVNQFITGNSRTWHGYRKMFNLCHWNSSWHWPGRERKTCPLGWAPTRRKAQMFWLHLLGWYDPTIKPRLVSCTYVFCNECGFITFAGILETYTLLHSLFNICQKEHFPSRKRVKRWAIEPPNANKN